MSLACNGERVSDFLQSYFSRALHMVWLKQNVIPVAFCSSGAWWKIC